MAWSYAAGITIFLLLLLEGETRTTDDSHMKTQKYQWKIDKMQWQVGTWGPCLPVSSSRNSIYNNDVSDHENLGVTQRNVSCVLISHDNVKVKRIVDEDNCFAIARKPDSVRFCHIPNPQDCIVSQFSEWSPCEGCGSEEEPANTTRFRVVLVAPTNGGKPCPELTETMPCIPNTECIKQAEETVSSDVPEYKLKVSEWRRCEPPTTVVSAEVIENRAVPHVGREIASHGLYSVSQSTNVIPSANGNSAERAEGSFVFQPQVGYQTREVSCRDTKGNSVDMSLCLGEVQSTPLPSRVRPCVVSQDCIVSQWSPWIRVQDGCVAANGKIRAEIHERRREVVKLPEGYGEPCPHLVESRQISDKEQLQLCAQKYHWLASKWSPCVVTLDESSGPRLQEVGCGGGIQLRDVTCVATQGNQPVPREMCESLEPIPTVQRCEVACPRDCEVGPWGPWGPCKPEQCPHSGDPPPKGYRERQRKIEVMASEQGLDCPSTTEVQPCPQPACYEWVTGPWSSCYLDPGVKHCGEGRKTRSVDCKSPLYGNIVDDSLCAHRQVKPPTEESCLLPCPYDCVLSPWSEWSPCSRSCSSPSQVALRQRNRTVIAPPGSGGHNCPNPDEMLQIEPCNTHNCYGYSWLTLPWQPCVVSAGASISTTLTSSTFSSIDEDFENRLQVEGFNKEYDQSVFNATIPSCGSGLQEREVWCMEANEKHVPDAKCHPLPKPITSRSCVRPCPIDCRTSPWSEWSGCPQQCVPDASNEVRDGEVTPTQSRHRVVINWPANGGTPCPTLEEVRPCPLSGARCKHYLWSVGPWSDCQLPVNVECGMGFRTRAVWCYRNHRNLHVEPSLCIEHNGSSPHHSEACYVDCQLPCTLSHWSKWSPCKHACDTRTRTRQLIGLSATRTVCKNTELFPLTETEPCPCGRYSPKPVGNWSDCILDKEIITVSANGRPALGICGSGTRFRRNGCFDEDGNLVEPSLCGAETGLEEELCLIPCPTDCLLDEWSPWGDCSSMCGPGMQNRTRQIIRQSLNAGRPCEETIQFKMCDKPCENYKWIVGGWSECQLIGADQNRGCGTGDQYRQVRCMHISSTELPTEVDDQFCDPVIQPADVNACHVACPGDCVLSPWSDWSECSQPCDSAKERQRTRSILRAPASESDICPPLIEVQSCQLNVTCFTYSWYWTDYSSCLPLGGSPCGEGIQSRAVYCVRSDGRPVSESFCNGEQKPAPSEKWCYVDCPVDCEVTLWTNWNSSDCQCGNEEYLITRYRYITTNPSERGRPCPTPLVQHKPCAAVPCYSWNMGEWGPCELNEISLSEGTWCGHGTIARNLTCLRDNSIVVEDRFCEATSPIEIQTQDSCYVPCRGDCQVSEWSHWSHCHRNCQGPDTGGYQTRSRAVLKPPTSGGEPCPTALWETRPCFTGPCLTFDWVLSDENQIVCQRSDGVLVTGGCDGKPKPCSVTCDTIAHALCDPRTGLCICAQGYQPLNPGLPLVCIAMASGTTVTDIMLRQRGFEDFATETIPADDEIQSRFYYPKDDEVNIWMFAVIGIGCMFIVFVAVSIYLMCYSSVNGRRGAEVQMLTMQQASKP